MKIQYTDGTARITADDREVIENCLKSDIGADYVVYGGIVWESEADSENDDGSRAIAKLWNDDGTEFTDELESL